MTPYEIALLRSRFYRIGTISRFLGHRDNADHASVMLLHIERSEHIEILRGLGYVIDGDEPQCPI